MSGAPFFIDCVLPRDISTSGFLNTPTQYIPRMTSLDLFETQVSTPLTGSENYSFAPSDAPATPPRMTDDVSIDSPRTASTNPETKPFESAFSQPFPSTPSFNDFLPPHPIQMTAYPVNVQMPLPLSSIQAPLSLPSFALIQATNQQPQQQQQQQHPLLSTPLSFSVPAALGPAFPNFNGPFIASTPEPAPVAPKKQERATRAPKASRRPKPATATISRPKSRSLVVKQEKKYNTSVDQINFRGGERTAVVRSTVTHDIFSDNNWALRACAARVECDRGCVYVKLATQWKTNKVRFHLIKEVAEALKKKQPRRIQVFALPASVDDDDVEMNEVMDGCPSSWNLRDDQEVARAEFNFRDRSNRRLSRKKAEEF